MRTEDKVEQQRLAWFREDGRATLLSPDIACYGSLPEGATVRDTLVPKLLSGELSVASAAALMEAHF